MPIYFVCRYTSYFPFRVLLSVGDEVSAQNLLQKGRPSIITAGEQLLRFEARCSSRGRRSHMDGIRDGARTEGGRDENYRMRLTRSPANVGDAGHNNGRSSESYFNARKRQGAGVLFPAPAASACRH